MKALIAILLLTASLACTDARLLPVGTIITYPDGRTETLNVVGFLLTRDAMEQATFALAVKPINEKEIEDLHLLSNKQEATIQADNTWKVFIGVSAFFAGFLLDAILPRT